MQRGGALPSVTLRRIKMKTLPTIIIALFVLAMAVLPSTNAAWTGLLTQDYLTLSFLDVGQGHSIWVRTPDNHN